MGSYVNGRRSVSKTDYLGSNPSEPVIFQIRKDKIMLFDGDNTRIPMHSSTEITEIYIEAPNFETKMFDLCQVKLVTVKDFLTLGKIGDIISQRNPSSTIYVKVDKPLEGKIFKYDNGQWQEYAHTIGFA